MPTQPENPEAGIRNHRLDFGRESEFGVLGADPELLKYSKAFTAWNWSSSSIIERVGSAGSVDPVDQEKGPEEHDLTVTYYLCKWFVDGSDANDAAYDGLMRDADNLLPNSHTVVDRETREIIAGENTHNGSTARPTRFYRVGRGSLIDEVTVTGDPSSAQPTQVNLAYKTQYVRPYQVDQPTDGEGDVMVAVESSDASDTSQTVTIEDEGAATTVSLSLDGTTLVSDATTFGDIDSVELSAETTGDVTVYINEGTDSSPTAGDTLTVLYGADSYDGIEGDTGIPALGAGSRETTASLGDYEKFIGDRILRDSTPYAHEIPNAELVVTNNIETTERGSGFGMAIHPGNREITLMAAMYGEATTYDMLDYHLRNEEKDHEWEMDGGTLTIEGAHLHEPGEPAAEEGNAVLTTENNFRGNGISIS